MFLGFLSGSSEPGQVGSWLVVLLAGVCALAFVGGMYWLFEQAYMEIQSCAPPTNKL